MYKITLDKVKETLSKFSPEVIEKGKMIISVNQLSDFITIILEHLAILKVILKKAVELFGKTISIIF